MDDNNPRPAQRQRVEAPQNQNRPLNMEQDRLMQQMLRNAPVQSAGATSQEVRNEATHRRGGGNEFQSYFTETNAQIARMEPGGENTRRHAPGGRNVPVQTSGQSSREGLDHPGSAGTAPANLRTSDFNRPNGEAARNLNERNRNNGRGNV
jgi:hypothetical protein